MGKPGERKDQSLGKEYKFRSSSSWKKLFSACPVQTYQAEFVCCLVLVVISAGTEMPAKLLCLPISRSWKATIWGCSAQEGWAWCGLLRGIGLFGPRWLELLLSRISPAAPTLLSWGKEDLSMGFLLLVYQAANPSCSLTAVSK